MAATKTTPPKTAVKSAAARPAGKSAPQSAATPPIKPAPDVPVVASSVTAAVAPALVAEKVTVTLKLKELIEQVVKTTGGKKKGVKEIVEATLATLGDALSKGHDLHLPPLGKAKVGRQKAKAVGELLVVKLHRGAVRGAGNKAKNEALAEAND